VPTSAPASAQAIAYVVAQVSGVAASELLDDVKKQHAVKIGFEKASGLEQGAAKISKIGTVFVARARTRALLLRRNAATPTDGAIRKLAEGPVQIELSVNLPADSDAAAAVVKRMSGVSASAVNDAIAEAAVASGLLSFKPVVSEMSVMSFKPVASKPPFSASDEECNSSCQVAVVAGSLFGIGIIMMLIVVMSKTKMKIKFNAKRSAKAVAIDRVELKLDIKDINSKSAKVLPHSSKRGC
jgi:hypothetical protein